MWFLDLPKPRITFTFLLSLSFFALVQRSDFSKGLSYARDIQSEVWGMIASNRKKSKQYVQTEDITLVKRIWNFDTLDSCGTEPLKEMSSAKSLFYQNAQKTIHAQLHIHSCNDQVPTEKESKCPICIRKPMYSFQNCQVGRCCSTLG